MNQLFTMLSRMFTNRLLNWGVRRMNAPKPGSRQTAQQKSREKTTRQAIKRARQAARITRRFGR